MELQPKTNNYEKVTTNTHQETQGPTRLQLINARLTGLALALGLVNTGGVVMDVMKNNTNEQDNAFVPSAAVELIDNNGVDTPTFNVPSRDPETGMFFAEGDRLYIEGVGEVEFMPDPNIPVDQLENRGWKVVEPEMASPEANEGVSLNENDSIYYAGEK